MSLVFSIEYQTILLVKHAMLWLVCHQNKYYKYRVSAVRYRWQGTIALDQEKRYRCLYLQPRSLQRQILIISCESFQFRYEGKYNSL
jgi:hypothetical protein